MVSRGFATKACPAHGAMEDVAVSTQKNGAVETAYIARRTLRGSR